MHRLGRGITLTAARRLARSYASNESMFCYQCEQTEYATGCAKVGICGKTPEVSNLQDKLLDTCKSLAYYHVNAATKNPRVVDFLRESMFATMTNVNFDADRFANGYQVEAEQLLNEAKKNAGELSAPASETQESGILQRKERLGEDVAGLNEVVLLSVKGLCAYFSHAKKLGAESDEVQEAIEKFLARLAEEPTDPNELLGMALETGRINMMVMEMLEEFHKKKFGTPGPKTVITSPQAGKHCLLVSGHDLDDLHKILEQTEGKDIDVYTHGEMMPAHAYPELNKFPHLKGHYGNAWQMQKIDFSLFPGAIVMTSNCIIEPRKAYKKRIFTKSVVGWPGCTHIEGDDYSAAINAATALPGFREPSPNDAVTTIDVGHHTDFILQNAGAVIDCVKNGSIKHFWLVGGCDGSESERSYYKDVALAAQENQAVTITLGCAKYRFRNCPEMQGPLDGTPIPKLLDMGQCNDSIGAVKVALALTEAFGLKHPNELPLSYAISWFEQKAVAVLMTLLHLGITNIRLGPNLPAFVTPTVLNILVEKFNIAPQGTDGKQDVLKALGK